MHAPDYRAQLLAEIEEYGSAEAVMQDAFAKIDALGAATAARRGRIDADPTIVRLRAAAKALTPPEPAYGTLGGMQVFAWLDSPENAELARINRQIVARMDELSRIAPSRRGYEAENLRMKEKA